MRTTWLVLLFCLLLLTSHLIDHVEARGKSKKNKKSSSRRRKKTKKGRTTTQEIADPVSTQYDPEARHSLSPPMADCLHYWRYGGSTVLTEALARITPSTADRRGWLWNTVTLITLIDP